MARVNDPYERQHIANLAKYARLIDEIFKSATREAASIGSLVRNFDNSRVFSFQDYPITHERIQSLLSWLATGLEVAITNGVQSEWTLANNKNNALSQRVFGNNVGKLTQAQYRRYFSNNDEARQAFLSRKEQGLNLSERVWRYANDFRKDIELGLDVGIRNGLDADAMSRELRTFLQQPEKLFRRVRDEHGELVLSQRASEYHPGQGVYRSSYKNARRLAVTETNMAYRTADYDRMQELDFVVGIEIKLSNNHTTRDSKGNIIPLHDICDDLKGRYPKDFKFTGFHPLCRCHVVTILKTEAELMEENRAILAGEEPSHDSVNAVNDVPDNFKGWVKDNASRIARAQSVPYFMSENLDRVSEVFTAMRPSTKMGDNALGTLLEYGIEMRDRDPRLIALWNEMSRSDLTDIEKTVLANQYKTICANYTMADLKEWGFVGEDMTIAGINREFVVQPKVTRYTKNGVPVPVEEVRRDMVVIRDRYGKQFAYPVGIERDKVLYSAVEASETIHTFPPQLQRGIKRVSFYPMVCPEDIFWKKEYGPNHVSAATDGGFTSFWTPSKGINFDKYMSHEAAHILDYGGRYSNLPSWRAAMKEDFDLFMSGASGVKPVPTEYAMTNSSEDFAESVMLFITQRDLLKRTTPARERFLVEMFKRLWVKGHRTP